MNKQSEMNYEILCIGGANVDRKIQTINQLKFETSNPASNTLSYGGVARNIAETLGRLGINTGLLGFVGADFEGEWLLRHTKKFVDINPTEIIQGKVTGTYTAVLDPDGQMAIAFADMAIYDEVEAQFIEKKWHHLKKAEIVLLDMNFPKDLIVEVIERCSLEKKQVCIATVSAPKVEKLPKALDGVTWLIANQKEAEAIAKIEIKTEGDFFRAAEMILKRGAERVVITRGESGLIYFTKAGEAGALFPPEIPVHDVTGAGDSLIAGILFGYLKGLSTEDACKIGISCSMITIQSNETVNPLLNQQVLLETFQKYFCLQVNQR
jgi:pseudouridine kinase